MRHSFCDTRELNSLAPKAKETWQAEKSRQTRDRIIASTISLIREGGFSAASSKRIAERSGMTWGAAQHHFGSKEQIFDAVIHLSHERFTARFADIEVERRSLKNRVSDFIDRMWAHYQDEVYLAAIEIIMASRDSENGHTQEVVFEWPSKDHIALMTRVFGDSGRRPSDLLDVLIFVHSLLTGLTITKVMGGGRAKLDLYLAHAKSAMESMIRSA